ncbi:MAG TPA: DEAD/DEAH box helicase family protein [Nanoarchaeota archaeon]|nr:MAG: hypothetical protein QT01_C0001G0018 [archaeon GW2011_AR6]MBS3083013.1 DEAD/DEAH box helicase family protein [Candidatus Pacearchaeota archaeon]HIH33653.1 DEAD/DEAH box helicase family protein [Nanoarchaeota archaeon]HIH66749.1 DEAD/DEAH box helicase family protein [Nanoarchaeota archaeon]
MGWNLYEEGRLLPPLKFSNGKTQEDVVNEVLAAIKEGHKVIFIKGVCGTGKSAIALNIINELGRGSIVVPVKALQNQYTNDYTNKLYLLKNCAGLEEESTKLAGSEGAGGEARSAGQGAQDSEQGGAERLKIRTIMGRGNFKCAYGNCPANDKKLPCTIEFKKENLGLLQKYLQENKLIPEKEKGIFRELYLEALGRFSVAAASPYWSPLLPHDISEKFRETGKCKVLSYDSISKQKYFLHLREPGCGFYAQYTAYAEADAIIFNSAMYEIENAIGRKPVTDVEIIDECDKFLDDLGNEREMNLDLLSLRLSQLTSLSREAGLREELMEFNDLVLDAKEEATEKRGKIILLKESRMLKVIKGLVENETLQSFDELERAVEIASTFEPFMSEAYISYSRDEDEHTIASIVTINLEKRLKELLDKNKVFVMMSGTIHSEEVLREVFGIKDYKIIEAETRAPGTVIEGRSGRERNFRFKALAEKTLTREEYLLALNECIKRAKAPALVQITSMKDLPTEAEKKRMELAIKSREEFQEERENFKMGELLEKFKEGKISILYGTTYNRGVDLPGEMCNSIILTKYPFPAKSSLFWKIFERQDKEKFRKFYLDTARREFLQRIYRGLRSQNDRIMLLSPDLACFAGRV